MAGGLVTRIPFAYRSGATMLHRIPAAVKLLCVILFSAAACSSVYGLAAAILLLVAASLFARIPPWELLKGSKPLLALSLCILVIKTFVWGGEGITASANGFFEGMLTVLRIFASFAAAALLFAVTTMRELRLSLAAIETFFVKRGTFPFFSLGVSLMLGFIPRFFDLWEASGLACEARSCRRGPRRLFILVPLVTERMMEAAAETAMALEARGLGNGNDN